MSEAPAPMRYLQGYSAELLTRVRELVEQGRLTQTVQLRHPQAHDVRSDSALYAHVAALRSRHMRHAEPLSKVVFDNKMLAGRYAALETLGTHSTVARVQGGRLKAKHEIRIASIFKQAPAPLLNMIVVHELAHLKVREHDKAFYALCLHMEPDYHQLEFDTRLWLTALELEGPGTA
ncbi:MAG: DUF45 domain-containing protein [Rubrivivax sp.]|nr:DUF45 domain-containing protein [Rubrivivax sp.]